MTFSTAFYLIACFLWGIAVSNVFKDLPLLVQMAIGMLGSIVLFFIIAAEERFK